MRTITRTSTRGVGRVVVGGWLLAVVGAAGCAARGGGGTEGVRPVSAQDSVARVVALADRRARGRYVGGPEDSVAIGYGSINRRRLTGSVSSVSGDVARSGRVMRAEELLYRVPGVQLAPRGDGSYAISIRGRASLGYSNTDPLFVFDGLPVDNGVALLHMMSPDDIERIDVLKDAEASIYGSRSANGVILVRTRHARVSND